MRIEGVTITGGSALQGGGINVLGGSLELVESVVADNAAIGFDDDEIFSDAWGGGIYATESTLTLIDSAVIDNRASSPAMAASSAARVSAAGSPSMRPAPPSSTAWCP